jgi:hypothetical protein
MRTFRAIPILFTLLFAAGGHADTFTITITSGTAMFPGPLTEQFGDTGSSTIDLTANVPALFFVNQFTNYVEGQIFPTCPASVNVVETIAANGISTGSLILNPDGCSLRQRRPAITVTTDLGAFGKVDVTLDAGTTAGITCTNRVPDLHTIVIIPGTNATALLHDVPKSAMPEPRLALPSIAGLAGLSFCGVNRKFARSS